jgi:alkanesulfonate monooxygenase SsuD/methylene tetrahydromethanopterin reductase-like flavin-dependent oxidoreductase (luciferase family)
VGIGSDRFGEEFSRFGDEVDDRRRAEMTDEALDILRTAWSGETVDHHGTHYTVDQVEFQPRPVRPRGIPIWIAGFPGKVRPRRRAARHEGFFPVNLTHPDELAEAVDAVTALRAAELQNPETPANPRTAASPETAANPRTPANPGTAANPGTPANPRPATNPETAANPRTPANPGTAANPGTPANPATQATPESAASLVVQAEVYDVAVALEPGVDPAGFVRAGATWCLTETDPEKLRLADIRVIVADGPFREGVTGGRVFGGGG